MLHAAACPARACWGTRTILLALSPFLAGPNYPDLHSFCVQVHEAVSLASVSTAARLAASAPHAASQAALSPDAHVSSSVEAAQATGQAAQASGHAAQATGHAAQAVLATGHAGKAVQAASHAGQATGRATSTPLQPTNEPAPTWPPFIAAMLHSCLRARSDPQPRSHSCSHQGFNFLHATSFSQRPSRNLSPLPSLPSLSLSAPDASSGPTVHGAVGTVLTAGTVGAVEVVGAVGAARVSRPLMTVALSPFQLLSAVAGSVPRLRHSAGRGRKGAVAAIVAHELSGPATTQAPQSSGPQEVCSHTAHCVCGTCKSSANGEWGMGGSGSLEGVGQWVQDQEQGGQGLGGQGVGGQGSGGQESGGQGSGCQGTRGQWTAPIPVAPADSLFGLNMGMLDELDEIQHMMDGELLFGVREGGRKGGEGKEECAAEMEGRQIAAGQYSHHQGSLRVNMT